VAYEQLAPLALADAETLRRKVDFLNTTASPTFWHVMSN
jgi:hypothetical protein